MVYFNRLSLIFACLLITLHTSAQASRHDAPNIIIIFADDLGYGDLGCYGHPTIETPYIDQMAEEGMRFTQFYVGGNVCTPSRAALLTGRLPIRFGMAGSKTRDVLAPTSALGLPQSEITIARALKAKDYKTGIIGKWHLGTAPQFMPNSHGFDYYFGLPYSNNSHPLPLYRNREIIEEYPDQRQLTQRYTAEVLSFIEENKERPFFLYYASNAPHIPLHASDAFKGKSKRGLYGDVVLELDWSVEQILTRLKELRIDKNTLVIFTSDNGPWLLDELKEKGGSAGLLFEGKGSAYEGGMREPAIFWWPGTIKPKQTQTALAATLDLFPTILKLAGVDLPSDRLYDGTDMMPLLTGQKNEVRQLVFYYNRSDLYAVRMGEWKAHFITKPSYSQEPAVIHNVPLLYNMEHDPSEKYNVNRENLDVIEEIRKQMKNFMSGVVDVPSRMDSIATK